MDIWMVTRTDSCDWDEYDAVVVRAESAQAAKRLVLAREDWGGPCYVGFTDANIQARKVPAQGAAEVILASFKAG